MYFMGHRRVLWDTDAFYWTSTHLIGKRTFLGHGRVLWDTVTFVVTQELLKKKVEIPRARFSKFLH